MHTCVVHILRVEIAVVSTFPLQAGGTKGPFVQSIVIAEAKKVLLDALLLIIASWPTFDKNLQQLHFKPASQQTGQERVCFVNKCCYSRNDGRNLSPRSICRRLPPAHIAANAIA